jgi:hypothetical protein
MTAVTVTLRRAGALALFAVALPLTSLGCSRAEPEPSARRDPAPSAPSATASVTSTTTAAPAENAASAASGAAAPPGPLVLARGVRIVHAAVGSDAAKVVRDERERAKSDGRDLVVYVGARWCEPCQHFHKAAAKGDLDADFPDLTLLEFDLDDDRDRLTSAGYVGQYIPMFTLPAADGRASDRKFEGSVKGNGAVANIAPRLRSLLRK